MCDSLREAEGTCREVTHVDGIHVTGDEAVTAPEPGRCTEAARLDGDAVATALHGAADGGGLRSACGRAFASQERAGFVPAGLASDDVFGMQLEFLASIRFSMTFDPATDL